MNITLLSLNLYSLISTSSFYTANHLFNGKRSITIFNSRFSHIFGNVIYSNSNCNMVFLQKDSFYNLLNSAIKLDDNTQNTIISNKYITSPFHYDNLNKYGDVIVSSCHFKNCHSKLGGAIYIRQISSVNIQSTFFENCSAETGGCCYILTNTTNYANDKSINYNDNLQTNVQYCCFSQFKVDSNLNEEKNGYGSILYIVSEKANLFYSTSIYPTGKSEGICESKGALFDFQSLKISMKNINSTKGRSKSCGCIEFKYSKSGIFRFLSIASIESIHITSFSEFECDTIEISSCNMIDNILRKSEDGTFPSLFHVNHSDLRITDSVFIGNNYGNTGKIVSKIDQKNHNQIIVLIGCISDGYGQLKSDEFITIMCDFNRQNAAVHFIDQVNLGHCEGNPETIQNKNTSRTFSEHSQIHSNQPKILDVSYTSTMTISNVYTMVKTVTNAPMNREIKTLTNCGDGKKCEINSNTYTHSDNIIYSISLTQTVTPVVIPTNQILEDSEDSELVKSSKKVGKICAIIEAVLIVVSLIIFIIRKKCTKDDYVVNEASSDEFGETHNLENIEQTNECEVNIVKPTENIDGDDTWL